MQIERRRFMEFAVHVKLASEAVLEAARNLTTLRPRGDEAVGENAWRRTMDELLALNVQLGFMERILSRAARDAVATPSESRTGRAITP